jgi:hypothetical protein
MRLTAKVVCLLAFVCASPALAAADTEPEEQCYDFVVIGNYQEQRWIGVIDGSLGMSSLFQVLVKVRKVLAGPRPPDLIWTHTIMHGDFVKNTPILLFLKRNEQGHYFAVRWEIADQDWLGRTAPPPYWNEGFPKKLTNLSDGLCQR